MKKSNYIHATAKRLISIAVSAALCFCFSVSTFAGLAPSHGQSAYERSVTEPRGSLGNVSVYVDGVKYGGKAFLHKSVTYVGIREFSMHMGVSSVSWNGNAKTATVSSDSLSVSAKNSALYITANGRYLWAGSGIIIINGTMFVPLRTLCKAFGYNVLWNSNEFAAYITKGEALKSGNSYYDNDSIYWLSRIIHAEASGESLLGKVAVGSVVLNRVANKEFPNTIYSVIFDRKNGVQFTPVANGAINCTPSEDSIIAAKLCLDGATISNKALFFVNEALAQSSWVSDNRKFIVAVGNHKFYA